MAFPYVILGLITLYQLPRVTIAMPGLCLIILNSGTLLVGNKLKRGTRAVLFAQHDPRNTTRAALKEGR